MENNLDNKIALLYEYNYSKTFTGKFKIDKINLDKIQLDDIKFKYNNSQSYHEMLTELFLGNFKLLEYNKNTRTTVIKRYSDTLSLSLYITPYQDDKNINSLGEPNNTDSLFSYLLSQLVLNKKTKHILLPIINIDAEFQQISDVLKPYKSYVDYTTGIENNTISNIFSIRVKEHFFKSMTLDQYLHNNECSIKPLLFQVIHTLAVLQNEYKGFRHNKLNFNNIYVYLKKDVGGVDTYTFNEKKYYVPRNSFEIKLSNFNHASISGHYSSNIKVPFSHKVNQYFDLHYFLNRMIHHELYNDYCDKSTKTFLDRVIPQKYRNKTNNYYMERNIQLFKPKELLDDKYFADYENKPEHIDSETMSENNYYSGIKAVLDSDNEAVLGKQYSKKKGSMNGTRKLRQEKTDTERINRNMLEMKGGGDFYKKPYTKVKNNPFISNDNRNVYKRNQADKPPPKPEKEVEVIAEQKIIKNPHYKPSFKPKPKPSWHHEYKPISQPHNVPQGKKYVPGDSPQEPSTYKPKHKPDYNPKFKPKVMSKYVDTTESEEKTESVNTTETMTPTSETMSHTTEEKREIEPYKKPYQKSYENPYQKPHQEPYHKPYNQPRQESYHKPYNQPRQEPYNQPRQEPYNQPRQDSYQKPYHQPHQDSYQKPQENTRRHPTYQQNITESPLIAEQKVYQPPVQPGSNHTHPKYNNPAFISLDNPSMQPPPFVYDHNDYPWPHSFPLKKLNEIPLQQVYNINLGNPTQGHSVLNSIYEDVLPGDPFQYTMNSVYERQQLISYIRNSILKKQDGQEMTLQGGDNSLMSYLRILEFNPYSVNGGNPYADIPINFLIFNAAYPVRFNGSSIDVAKNSLGLNVRIYSLSVGAENYQSITSNTNATPSRQISWYDYDVWREIHYYEYIKEKILKQKISPNFITLLFYVKDTVSKIKYEELNNIIKNHGTMGLIDLYLTNQKKINTIVNRTALESLFGWTGPADVDLSKYSGNSLIAVTEAPTNNIVQWATPIYENNAAQKKMISTGHHTPEVWRSVLFQIVYACAVLQKHDITFRNFSLGNNIFIKDLFSDPHNIGHWLYKVDDFEFYVPNYGYLVLIDSRYVDIDRSGYTIDLNAIQSNSQEFKIKSPGLFTYNGDITGFNTFNGNLQYIMNELQSNTDINIPGEILTLITKIQTIAIDSIETYLSTWFPEFLHNRIGTLLTKSERDNININIMPKFKKGQLVVYQSRYEQYEWAIYKDDAANKKRNIITKDGTVNEVFNHSLIQYPENEPVSQDAERNYKLNADSLIETYQFQ